MAKNVISSKRLHLDDLLNKVIGVQFSFSSVTAVSTNAKQAKNCAEASTPSADVYPAVAYFIIYRETDSCNKNKIHSLFHNEDTKQTTQPITIRNDGPANNAKETAARQLYQVEKDHNYQMIVDMVNTSNIYYLSNCTRTTSAEESEDSVHAVNAQPRYSTTPCRLVVVNTVEFDSPKHKGTTN